MPDTRSLDLSAGQDGTAVAVLDPDGLLRFDGRWVAVTDAQLPVVELLVERQGLLVKNSDLLTAYQRGTEFATVSSLRTAVHRLRRRVRTVGLTLHVIRGRGVLLEPAKADA